ncbi:uncharacterized protein GGS22DRAFT_188894 [Annulohypoxylon maeteangense]|uniref:uncharacterized protein n=1 Tax=Annulohypoxylon maeteangense TaxID=1927788 RepID=UPI002007BB90|nr:uncharacterized protein GGS22DRAFT_188894 [Annulohypoxylon maeteangense]KAI0884685.1 hypothetical protein GGS22DRAFT_188894 [Annulohypoxylon maeteangense]
MKCANWKDGGKICPSEGKFACNACKLVAYCGRDCQREHWTEHKKQCKSSLRNENWTPAWDLEQRTPQWASERAAFNMHNPFGEGKHLWGNTPAMDVLRLHDNEGQGHDKHLSILFAASGDLRNVIKTVQNYDGDLHITMAINDKDSDIMIRNAILLLLVLASLDEESEKIDIEGLAEAMMHVWYSAMLTKDTLSLLQSKVKPLISKVCQKISSKTSGLYLGQLWHFKSKCSLRLTLREKDWIRALTFLEVPKDLTAEKAREMRHAIVLAPERKDYRERWYFKDASPSMRIAKQRFREDGLLLPFGYPRVGFDYPNPTIFQAAHNWPLDDQANPLGSWPIGEVRSTPCQASEDVYGRLYFYLRNVLSAFIRKVAAGKIYFELTDNDAKELRNLRHEKYDRIEASNISDMCWLGTPETLGSLAPLLKPPQVNPHATLITVYLNAVMEMSKMDEVKGNQMTDYVEDVQPYLKERVQIPRLLRNPQGAEVIRLWDARALVMDATEYFRKYMEKLDFPQIAQWLGVAMKEENTIGDPWPTALKLAAGEPGAVEEFGAVLASTYTGVERYVEWKRVR